MRHQDDIKNLKIRVPDTPVSVAIFKSAGANPVPIAWSELYLSLQQGVVEGEENSFGQILSGKFHEVQKYVTLTEHQYSTNAIVISEDTWNKLTTANQQILAKIVREESDNVISTIINNNAKYKAELEEKGMEMVKPDLDAFRKMVLKEIKNYDFWNEELYQAFQAIK